MIGQATPPKRGAEPFVAIRPQRCTKLAHVKQYSCVAFMSRKLIDMERVDVQGWLAVRRSLVSVAIGSVFRITPTSTAAIGSMAISREIKSVDRIHLVCVF